MVSPSATLSESPETDPGFARLVARETQFGRVVSLGHKTGSPVFRSLRRDPTCHLSEASEPGPPNRGDLFSLPAN